MHRPYRNQTHPPFSVGGTWDAPMHHPTQLRASLLSRVPAGQGLDGEQGLHRPPNGTEPQHQLTVVVHLAGAVGLRQR